MRNTLKALEKERDELKTVAISIGSWHSGDKSSPDSYVEALEYCIKLNEANQ